MNVQVIQAPVVVDPACVDGKSHMLLYLWGDPSKSHDWFQLKYYKCKTTVFGANRHILHTTKQVFALSRKNCFVFRL